MYSWIEKLVTLSLRSLVRAFSTGRRKATHGRTCHTNESVLLLEHIDSSRRERDREREESTPKTDQDHALVHPNKK